MLAITMYRPALPSITSRMQRVLHRGFEFAVLLSPYPLCAKRNRSASDVSSLNELLSVEMEVVRLTIKHGRSALHIKV